MAASYVSMTVLDEAGGSSNLQVFVGSPAGATTVTALLADVVALAQLVANISIGQVLKAEISLQADISTLINNGAPLTGSDIYEKAAFVFRTDGGYVTRVAIPCLPEAKVVAGSHDLDQTDTDILAFINAMESGTGLSVFDPTDYRGDDIVNLEIAQEWFRSSRLTRG